MENTVDVTAALLPVFFWENSLQNDGAEGASPGGHPPTPLLKEGDYATAPLFTPSFRRGTAAARQGVAFPPRDHDQKEDP